MQVWRKLCKNSPAWLAVLLALHCWPMGYVKPWCSVSWVSLHPIFRSFTSFGFQKSFISADCWELYYTRIFLENGGFQDSVHVFLSSCLYVHLYLSTCFWAITYFCPPSMERHGNSVVHLSVHPSISFFVTLLVSPYLCRNCLIHCLQTVWVNHIPCFNEGEMGYAGFTLSSCPSLCLWTESCPLCIFNKTRRIHFIFALILSSNFRRCVTCKVCFKIRKSEILANSLNL